MYIVALAVSFKIALLISIFLVIKTLRKEAKYLRELGATDSEIRRLYRENAASSSATVGQVTLVAGSVFSLLSLTVIWSIS